MGGTTTTTWFDAHLPSLVAVDILDGNGSHTGTLPPLELGPPSSASAAATAAVSNAVVAEGTVAIPSTMAATIVEVAVEERQTVKEGQVLAVVSAMKMEHVILCELPEGVVVRLHPHTHALLSSIRTSCYCYSHTHTQCACQSRRRRCCRTGTFSSIFFLIAALPLRRNYNTGMASHCCCSGRAPRARHPRHPQPQQRIWQGPLLWASEGICRR